MNTQTLAGRLPARCEQLADRLAATALASMPQGEIAELSTLYEQVLESPASEENEILLLLTRPFSQRLPIPEYYRYTGLHVFDWFLSRRDDTVGGCLLAMLGVLNELARLERREASRHTTVPEHIVERLRRLHPLIDTVTDMFVAPYSSLRGHDLLAGVAEDRQLGQDLTVLTRCTGFRRSDKHDEHVFIRAVHACELIFFMVRWCARQAMAAIGDDRTEFLFRMGQIAACTELLNTTFHMLRTLSPELFLGFRDETGAASAVQSMNYHLMELVVYGHDHRKAQIYDELAHLAPINSGSLREFSSLRDVVRISADAELIGAFEGIERTLLTWRGRHYGFGRTYLPGMKGSGGTEGADYLKQYIRKEGLPSGAQLADPAGLLSRFAYC